MADDRGDEFLSVWTGRDVIRRIHRAWLSKRDTRKSSSQPDKKTIEKNRDYSDKKLRNKTHEQIDPRHRLPLEFQSLVSSCQLGGGAHCRS